jgi:excisionase family DNA binding protein
VSKLLTTADVARIFRVEEKTVRSWARDGRLPHIRTLGGNYRFRADEVEKLRTKHQEDRK